MTETDLSEVVRERLKLPRKRMEIISLGDTEVDRIDRQIQELESLRNMIEENRREHADYEGFNMSGYGFGDAERTHLAQERCRVQNWILVADNFRDYLPDMTIDGFELHCWKGHVWWGDRQENFWDNKPLTGWTTANIIEWIIVNHGVRKC